MKCVVHGALTDLPSGATVIVSNITFQHSTSRAGTAQQHQHTAHSTQHTANSTQHTTHSNSTLHSAAHSDSTSHSTSQSQHSTSQHRHSTGKLILTAISIWRSSSIWRSPFSEIRYPTPDKIYPFCTWRTSWIVYSKPSNYGLKNYCVALSGPPLGLNDYSRYFSQLLFK